MANSRTSSRAIDEKIDTAQHGRVNVTPPEAIEMAGKLYGRKQFAQAEKVFPGVEKAYTGRAVRQIWPKYEWSLGSYTCFRPGQYQRYFGALGQPQGRLIFAGEHTVDESGFMNSAVESGERAATQVLAALGIGETKAA